MEVVEPWCSVGGLSSASGRYTFRMTQQSQRPADCDLADFTRSAFSTYELMLRQVKEAHLFRNLVRTSEGKI